MPSNSIKFIQLLQIKQETLISEYACELYSYWL